MILLSASDLTKHYGPEPVLQGAAFEVRRGERIGLVGPNGAGKTTLLRIAAGLEEPDSGAIQRPPGVRVALLRQQPEFPADQTVWQAARSALARLTALAEEAEQTARALSCEGEASERKKLAERFDRLQAELHRLDGFNPEHRIERVLEGLGLGQAFYEQPARQLSGGQQNRLLLAMLLLEDPDLMLLDEPSNHLDMAAAEWLEEYLRQSRRAMIVVSHDRYLLDRISLRTLELFRGVIDSFPGNFSAYRRQKAERLEVERRTYERRRSEIAKMEEFIRRHHYGQKHAQAEDRRKKLERMRPAPPPRVIAGPPMGFPTPARAGDVVIRAEGIAKAFDRPLFNHLSFDLLRGQKWGVLGPNGCGKTTLLRCIVGQQPLDEGRILLGAGVQIGYFDQLLEQLDETARVLDAIRPDGDESSEQARRNRLARFGITGDMALQPIRRLSGGQRSRVALAALAASGANLLLLDEPTNHLDLWARESLEKSLQQYDGAVLLVSHDRYFLNRVVDHLLVAEPGGFRVIEGDYDTYQQLRRGASGADDAPAPGGKSARNASRSTRRRPEDRPTPRRRWRFPYRKVEDLEAEILQRESRVEELHQALASPQVLRDGSQVKQLKQELNQQREAIARLYEHWEEAVQRC